jgi:hypothetical protein
MIRIALIVLLLSQSASAQGMLDWLGSTPAAATSSAAVDAVASMRSEVLSKQPAGKTAYIVAVCSADQFDAWLKRIDVVAKGWGVVRMDPKVDRPTSFVVIDGSITSLMNLPTGRDLNRVLMNLASVRDEKRAAAATKIEITIFKRANCGWCDAWMRDEAPKARAAGAIVLEATELDNSIPVPHFVVCGADKKCRMFSGFTLFEVMR